MKDEAVHDIFFNLNAYQKTTPTITNYNEYTAFATSSILIYNRCTSMFTPVKSTTYYKIIN